VNKLNLYDCSKKVMSPNASKIMNRCCCLGIRHSGVIAGMNLAADVLVRGRIY
jgi:hypothetical protein